MSDLDHPDAIDAIDDLDDLERYVDPEDGPPPRRWGAIAAVATVVLAVVGLLVLVLLTSEPATDRQVDSPLLGRVAPGLVGATLDGGSFDLLDERGDYVLVNFFATWCAPCVQEHDDLVAFDDAHRLAGDASVVSVVFDDTADDARRFFAERGGSFPVVVGDEGDIALDFGVAKVPESYLIAPDGTVVAKITGGVTVEGLEALLATAQGSGGAG